MSEELNIISPAALVDINKNEVNQLVNQIVDKSKNNMEEICELTLECTTLLSSSESRTKVLENQGVFKRLIGNITGNNRKLQNAILQDNTNALYAAQGIINRVMLECTNNRRLFVAINNKLNDLYTELKEDQNDVTAIVMKNRQAFVKFYEKWEEENSTQNERIDKIEKIEKRYCRKCNRELFDWQRVCPYCGDVHSLKTDGLSEETKQILNEISKVMKDQTFSEEIVWDLTARKIERKLRRVRKLARIGKIPGYTKELDQDIRNLMNKCKDAEFQIAVVGVMKAGKSFLMNALIGVEVASVEVNPETAALTKFRSADGYYVNIKFHNKNQWTNLKKSAKYSKKTGKDSLISRLNDPVIIKMEKEWVNHEDLSVKCTNLKEVQETVKKYTSSRTREHLFVSEVEVGIDKSIFNMPKEVVFVDTPGLKDPVKYRSDITKKYIKKADAVLVALKPGPFTAEGLEIVTTVLDCTDTRKAYIVGTQKDLNSEEECEKYVSNWIEHLVNAKRYRSKRQVINRVILTSAKMELLINKWNSLSEEEKEDSNFFNDDDYNDLQSFAGKVLKKRKFYLFDISNEDMKEVSTATGISLLKNKLEMNLIANYRKLKLDDIEKMYIRCEKKLISLGENALEQQENSIALAEAGTEALQERINCMLIEKDQLVQEGTDLKNEAQMLENVIKNKIKSLEIKGI